MFRKRVFFSLLFTMITIVACHKETVNLREMAPDEQFAYAKSIFDKKDYYKAKLQFTMIVINNSGHQVWEKAQFYLSESHYYQKEYILAIEEYEKLIRSMPRSEFADDARYKIGLSYFKLAPNFHLDQEYTLKAITELQTFMEEYPQSELKEEVNQKLRDCRNKLGMKEFKSGELYRKMGYPTSALISFNEVLKNYYDTDCAEESLYWKGECHRIIGELEDSEMAFQQYISKYPNSVFTNKAKSKLASIQKKLEKYSTREK